MIRDFKAALDDVQTALSLDPKNLKVTVEQYVCDDDDDGDDDDDDDDDENVIILAIFHCKWRLRSLQKNSKIVTSVCLLALFVV